MKQKKLPRYFNILNSFTLIVVAVTSFYLSGCGITQGMGAERKYWLSYFSSPSYRPNCEYWKIKEVDWAVKQVDGDILICVRLLDNDDPFPDNKPVTITLPSPKSKAEIAAEEKLEASAPECPINDALYRVEKTKEACNKTHATKPSPIAIERLKIPIKGRIEHYDFNRYPEKLFDLLDTNDKDLQKKEKIFEIALITDDEINNNYSESNSPVLVVYWLFQTDHQGEPPIIIEGAYLDESSLEPYPVQLFGAFLVEMLGIAILYGVFLLF